ncbi:MAG: FAD-dependent thymidylate synthase [Candidatus Daviesbacteria bacterium]|nr:FAD-dependent thymidylate synthase [Candidatus Daviesbacteria bacterium]
MNERIKYSPLPETDKVRAVTPKVVLIDSTENPEQTVAVAIRQCYSAIGAADLLEKISEEQRARLIRQVMASGHHSTIEHAYFNFAIEGISRAASHQLVRHRIASYSQQSQRYVEFKAGKKFDIIIAPSILKNKELTEAFVESAENSFDLYRQFIDAKIPGEDARLLLPNMAATKIVTSMDARSLFNFLEVRLCKRAQWEIRWAAALMKKQLMEKAPNIFKYTGPTCHTEGICWEGNLACDIPSKNPNVELRERFARIIKNSDGPRVLI